MIRPKITRRRQSSPAPHPKLVPTERAAVLGGIAAALSLFPAIHLWLWATGVALKAW